MSGVTSDSLQATMTDCYQSAVTLMQHDDREGAQYMRGYGDSCKDTLVALFGYVPDDHAADLLAILADL